MAQKMDKNSLIGFLLIGIILFAYTFYLAPTEEEKAAFQVQQDSIKQAEQVEREAEEVVEEIEATTPSIDSTQNAIVSDSVKAIQVSAEQAELKDKFGQFASASTGNNEEVVLENENIRLVLGTKGGRPLTAELKDYQTFNGQTVRLFDEDSSQFELDFVSNSRMLKTSTFYFKNTTGDVSVTGEDYGQVSMRLYSDSPDKYIEFIYGLKGNSYDVDFRINYVGMDDLLASNGNQMKFLWQMKSPAKEKGFTTENIRTSIFFKEAGEDRDYISERSVDKLDLDEELESDLDWIAFKQQFFTVAISSPDKFIKKGGSLETVQMPETGSNYIKDMIVSVQLPVDPGSKSSAMSIFIGPNDYSVLKERNYVGLLDFGWGLFGWVGEWFIRPIFSLLGGLNISYGIIILLLTLLIKLILSPLTYKSYLSGAKMKVLKPEIAEINEKFKNADPMKKQQEVMGLYRKAGVNPLAGCLPMLLQMPILYAMFMFFPTSIELRGQSFLWAEDLAAFDSIYTLPFPIWQYGSEVSLFTLLMAASMFFYTRSNMASGAMGAGNDMQAQQMKIMMYFMPVMMLFFFNSYPAGLSYYYLCANVTSIAQNWAFRKYLVDDEAIHAQVQENKKKPKKKGKFQQRMENLAKQKGIDVPKK